LALLIDKGPATVVNDIDYIVFNIMKPQLLLLSGYAYSLSRHSFIALTKALTNTLQSLFTIIQTGLIRCRSLSHTLSLNSISILNNLKIGLKIILNNLKNGLQISTSNLGANLSTMVIASSDSLQIAFLNFQVFSKDFSIALIASLRFLASVYRAGLSSPAGMLLSGTISSEPF
jgi:hypothetical protein